MNCRLVLAFVSGALVWAGAAGYARVVGAAENVFPVTHDSTDPVIIKGRTAFQAACMQCHSPFLSAILRDGKYGWRELVDEMVLTGAQLDLQERDAVVEFLALEYGAAAGRMQSGRLAPDPAIATVDATITQPDAILPNGKGKDLTLGFCQMCHDLSRVVSVRRPAADWAAITKNMMSRGFEARPEDVAAISAYLTEHFGMDR